MVGHSSAPSNKIFKKSRNGLSDDKDPEVVVVVVQLSFPGAGVPRVRNQNRHNPYTRVSSSSVKLLSVFLAVVQHARNSKRR